MKKYFFVILIFTVSSCNTQINRQNYFYNRDSKGFLGNVKECHVRTYDSFHKKSNDPEPVASSISDSAIWHFNEEGYITHADQYYFSGGIVAKHNSIKYNFSNNIPVKLEFYTNDTLQKVTEIKFLNDTTVQEDARILSTGQRLKSTITIARDKEAIIETNHTVLEFDADMVDMITTTNNIYGDGILTSSAITSQVMHEGEPFSDGRFDYRDEYNYTILKKDQRGNPSVGLIDIISDYGREKHTVLYESSYTYWK